MKFMKEIQIKPVNNRPGVFTNMYDHFVVEDEMVRAERDVKTSQSKHGNAHRMLSYRFMPQIIDSNENRELLKVFQTISDEYIELAEQSM